METKKFLNNYQPSTLQNATMLLYINAVFSLLLGGFFVVMLVSIAGAGAGYGIANDKKWGYYLGLVAAIVPLAFWVLILLTGGFSLPVIINILFKAALLALLVHPISKGYVNTWFK